MEFKKFFVFSFVLVFAAACLPACSKSESAGGHDRTSATGTKARSKPFVASARREVYHRSDCRWAAKINDDNLLGYDTFTDAESDGFRPCKVCKPGHSHVSIRGHKARNKPFFANARRKLYYRKGGRGYALGIDDEDIMGYDTAAAAEADGFQPCPKSFENKGQSYPYYPYPHAESEKAKLMADLPAGIDEAWVNGLVFKLSKKYHENPGRFWAGIDALLYMRKYRNKEALERQMRQIIEMSPRRHGM